MSSVSIMKTGHSFLPGLLPTGSPSNTISKKRERANTISNILKNSDPTEYVKSVFNTNGCKDIQSINKASIVRFQLPTKEMIEEYGTEIVTAVRSNDVHRARQLYQNGTFQYNACNRFGESILHIACRRGHLGMVQFLIEEVGLRVDTIRDDYHRTPLHDAFWTSKASYDVVDYLLRQPNVADLLLLQDKRGCTPLGYARLEDNTTWLRFFWERQALLQPTPTTANSNTIDKQCIVSEEEEEQQQPIIKRPRLCSMSADSAVIYHQQ